MGLAASQGRMLLLTARKSDLEFRAQQISQKRLILSQQLEQISSDYEDATSNRQMKIKLYESTNGENTSGKTSATVNLTYATLISGTLEKDPSITGIRKSEKAGTDDLEYTSNSAYRLKDYDGAIVVSDVSELPGWVDGAYINASGDLVTKKEGEDKEQVIYTKSEMDGRFRRDLPVYERNADGTLVRDEDNNPVQAKDADGKPLTETVTYVVDKNLLAHGNDPNYLQDALRNGKYLIEKLNPDTETWRGLSWDAATNITDSYYQDDDDEAKAKYDRLQAEIQNQDKKLEIELDNVETQRSAVQTEMDSVKKVVSENIEKTFNAFG